MQLILVQKTWISYEEKTCTDEDMKHLIYKIVKNITRWHNIKLKAKRIYEYIKWPSDFKLVDSDLQLIDNNISDMIEKTHTRIYDVNKNTKKIKYCQENENLILCNN